MAAYCYRDNMLKGKLKRKEDKWSPTDFVHIEVCLFWEINTAAKYSFSCILGAVLAAQSEVPRQPVHSRVFEVNIMQSAGENLHFVPEMFFCCKKSGNKFFFFFFNMLWHLWFLPSSLFNFGSALMPLSGRSGMQHALNVMSHIKLDYTLPGVG